MLYHHHSLGGSAVSALPPRRTLSLWGLGAAAGLLSFPLRAWSGEAEPIAASSESVPDGLELSGELCPAPVGGPLVPPESCDLSLGPDGGGADTTAAAALLAGSVPESSLREAALFTVLGGDARPLVSVSALSDISDLSEGLILSQAPATSKPLESEVPDTTAGGFSNVGLWLVGGGAIGAVAIIAGGDEDDSPSNRAPELTEAVPATLTATEGRAANWEVADWFIDPDEDDTLVFVAINLPSWLALNRMTGALTIAARATDDAQVGFHTLTITARDQANATAAHTVRLEIVNVPEPPVVDLSSPLTAEEGMATTWTVSDWFTDPDTGDTLTFTASRLPSWLVFNSAMTELSIAAGATDDEHVRSYTFTITARDEANARATLTATLTVENNPEPPVVVTTGVAAAPETLTVQEGEAAMWTLAGWFSDPDAGDTLTFTAMDLPAWLTLDTTKGELKIEDGATDDAQIGSYTFTITARDTTTPTALTAVHTVTLTVENVPEPPETTTVALETLTAEEGEPKSWDISDWFTDPDAGDTLNVTAMELPDWLVLNTMTDALTIEDGATGDIDVGVHTLTITASDATGLHATHVASLTITDSGPVLSGTLPNRIVPTGSITLNLADFFTDENARPNASGSFTFEVSSSIDDTITDENIITAELTGAILTLTPGEPSGPSGGIWERETVTITATDIDEKQGRGLFTVVTRQNVLDTSMLAPAHGFILQGDEMGDELGSSVSGAGDVNGDGLADLIVGALFGDDGGSAAGEAYVVYGKADTTGDGLQFGGTTLNRQVLDTTTLKSTDGFIIQGETARDRLGSSVSGAGDINGDGFDDLIVGAREGDDGGSAAGEAYIIYGKAGTGSQFGTSVTQGQETRQVLDTTNLAPAAGFIIQGDEGGDWLGISVSGIGDINSDGFDDLIVGAYRGDDGGSRAGEAYIIYGKAGTGSQFGTLTDHRQVLDTTTLKPTDGFILQGDVAGDRLGISVSGAGDINGDGLADLIVGANEGGDGGTEAGEAYIIYGKAGFGGAQFGASTERRQVLDTSLLAPAAGFILQGDEAGDELGHSVAGAGDINGDGFDDLIVGALGGNDGGNNAGEAYIIYGKPGTGSQFGMMVETVVDGNTIMRQVLDITSLSVTDGFILQGDAADDQLGFSVSGAGDVNGDGLADLIAGANEGDDGGTETGEAYIIYGKAGTDGMQFGTSVTDTDSGQTRQVLDTATLSLEPTVGFIIQGDAADDELGVSVSGAGDVNGDGFDDLIAGANEGGDGGSGAGEAYVIYGGAHLGEVVSHAQTLEGAASEASLLGGAGDDRLEGHADTEVLYGGAGDDTLELADATFRRVDGGSGDDRLVLGTSLTLDFTEASDRGRVRGIETLSLSDATSEVTLDLLSVYALVESRDNRGTHTSVIETFLRLEGVGMVVLEDLSSWTPTAAEGPDLYALGSARLLIDDGLVVVDDDGL